MKKGKRLLALVAAILLLISILTICVLLFFSKNFSDEFLRGLISCLIAIPIVAYGYMLILKYAAKINKEKITDED